MEKATSMLRLVILAVVIFSSSTTTLVVFADLDLGPNFAHQTTYKNGGIITNTLQDGVISNPVPEIEKPLEGGISISIPGTPPVGGGVTIGVPETPPVTAGITIGIPGTPPVGSGIFGSPPSVGLVGITKPIRHAGNPPPSIGISNSSPQTGSLQVGIGITNPAPPPPPPPPPAATQPVGTANESPPTANPPLELSVGPVEEYVGKPMARQFVIAHNKIRAKFNLPPLKWNRTLARFARRWAYERMSDCKVLHSTNNFYGENLFWSLKSHWTPRDVVSVWSKEHKYYNPNTNECINNSICGHYTQIIWHTTSSLGCGRVECLDDKGFLYVCSYDPPGNYYYEGPFGGRFEKSIVPPLG